MKRNILIVIVLVVFLLGGILIYDFSDELDSSIKDKYWYIHEKDITYIMSFSDKKFKYTLEDGTVMQKYASCNTYYYNSNISVIKLDCDNEYNKIYIAKSDDKSITLTMDGVEKVFYTTKDLAVVESFKKDNNLTDEEYDSILALTFDENINLKQLNQLTKSKDISYVALIRTDINYHNALKYQKLNSLINDKYYFINIDELNETELNKLKKKLKLDEVDDNGVYIYKIKDKKISLYKEM